jgi:hypothetical protein
MNCMIQFRDRHVLLCLFDGRARYSGLAQITGIGEISRDT